MKVTLKTKTVVEGFNLENLSEYELRLIMFGLKSRIEELCRRRAQEPHHSSLRCTPEMFSPLTMDIKEGTRLLKDIEEVYDSATKGLQS